MPIIWGAGLGKEIAQILAVGDTLAETDNSLSYRLIDAYGLFELLIAKSQVSRRSTKQEEIAS